MSEFAPIESSESLSNVSLPVIRIPMSEDNMKVGIKCASAYSNIDDLCDYWVKAEDELKGNLVKNKDFTNAVKGLLGQCLELCDIDSFNYLGNTFGKWLSVDEFLEGPEAFKACQKGLVTELKNGRIELVTELLEFMQVKKLGDGFAKSTLGKDLLIDTYKKATLLLLSSGNVSSFDNVVQFMEIEGIDRDEMKEFFHSKDVHNAIEKGIIKKIEMCAPEEVEKLIEKLSEFGATEQEIKGFFSKSALFRKDVVAAFKEGCKRIFKSYLASPERLRVMVETPNYVPENVSKLSALIIRNGADMNKVLAVQREECADGVRSYLELCSQYKFSK